jgi:diacylglycerol kinase family enzyme
VTDSAPVKPGATPLTVLVNPHSGSAEEALSTLRGDRRIRPRLVEASELPAVIDQLIAEGRERILVCGGDGTLSQAAGCVAGRGVELAILPGGTLNHFAARLDIPTDLTAALELALTGEAQRVDVGYVNEQLFLNTSSVGAYTTFVRHRDYLERRYSYLLASLIAGIRRLFRWRRMRFNLGERQLRSPLVFVGLQERELRLPQIGSPKPGGDRGLHMIAILTDSAWETLLTALSVLFRGIDPLAREGRVEHAVVQRLEMSFRHRRRRRITIAIDGEPKCLRSPLHYRLAPGALRVVAGSGAGCRRVDKDAGEVPEERSAS